MNKLILMKAGVPEKNILITKSIVLVVMITEFFSHRRDQGQTGRMLSLYRLEGDRR